MTAVIEIDEEREVRPVRRVGVAPWVVAVVALAAGLLGGTVAVVAQAWPEPAVEPITHEVRFETTGDLVTVFTSITGAGVDRVVAPDGSYAVAGPATVTVTVLARVHTLRELAASTTPLTSSCRILVDGVVVAEKIAAGGTRTTCAAAVR